MSDTLPASHEHDFHEFTVCRICGQTEAALTSCHHCDDADSLKNGRCWWCLQPVATSNPAAPPVPSDPWAIPVYSADVVINAETGAVALTEPVYLKQDVDEARAASEAAHTQEIERLNAHISEYQRALLDASAPGGWVFDLRGARLRETEEQAQRQYDQAVSATGQALRAEARAETAEAENVQLRAQLKREVR